MAEGLVESVTFSIITPTDGRVGTKDCVEHHLRILGPDDEYILIGMKGNNVWGNKQRDMGIKAATKSHIICIDDDDMIPDLEAIRKAVATNPKVPHMFCIDGAGISWNWLTEQPEEHIAGHCMVLPNDKLRIPSWVECVNSIPFKDAVMKIYENQHIRHPDIVLNHMRAFDRMRLDGTSPDA